MSHGHGPTQESQPLLRCTVLGEHIVRAVNGKSATGTPTTCASSCADSEGDTERLLVSGGDDRTVLDLISGTNSYHCEPRPIGRGDVSRSSCTCNPPTAEGHAAARSLIEDRFAAPLACEDDASLAAEVAKVHEEHRAQLRLLLRLPEGTELAFCPSGSDAEFVPLMIAAALAPGRRVVNILTQHRETGSGTGAAAAGRFFTQSTPLAGENPARQKDLLIAGLSAGVTTRVVPARHRDGSPVDTAAAVAELQQQADQAGDYVITHVVAEGKTGLQDAHMPETRGAGTGSLAVVDACQVRCGVDDISRWLTGGAVVLITGSKFYQGPPFSGCVLVPSAVAGSLKAAASAGAVLPPTCLDHVEGLGAFFSSTELPPCLCRLAPGLPSKPNLGLALRWRAALANMAPLLLRFPADEVRESGVRAWEAAVVSTVHELGRGVLEVWSARGGIVSIRVRRQAAGPAGGSDCDPAWLGVAELRRLFGWCACDATAMLPPIADAECAQLCSRRCFLGQPVDVADSFAVIRIALGAKDLERWLSDDASPDNGGRGSAVLKEDRVCVQKLALLAANFATAAAAEDAAVSRSSS